VELTVDPALETFAGVTSVDLDLAVATPVVWLNATELKVTEATVSVGGQTLPVETIAGGEDFVGFRFPRPLGPGAAQLRVSYQGVLSRRETTGLFAQEEGEAWYVFSQFEPIAARRVIPCFDEQLSRSRGGLRSACHVALWPCPTRRLSPGGRGPCAATRSGRRSRSPRGLEHGPHRVAPARARP
jgi:hypothetical protein